MANWLSLNEYATKHKVSVSTLRRRIKTKRIQFRLDEGKYFIREEQSSNLASQDRNQGTEVMGSDYSTTKLVLDELKMAYQESLKGKDTQILQLKQQVSDLKTLVLILEQKVNFKES